jgi:hypothetical protein
LFIINCAIPAYTGAVRHPPSHKKLTAHRRKRNVAVGEIDKDTQDYWRGILKGVKQGE